MLKSPHYLNVGLVVLCGLMTSANMFLLHQNKVLRSQSSKTSLRVPEGTVVSTLAGLDFDNKPVNFSTADRRATVVLVYSPTCHYCEMNWANWRNLIANVNSSRVRFIAADVTSNAHADFLGEKGVKGIDSIHRVDPGELVSMELDLTPQTILIGADSRVKHVWSGVLSPKDLSDLKAMVARQVGS